MQLLFCNIDDKAFKHVPENCVPCFHKEVMCPGKLVQFCIESAGLPVTVAKVFQSGIKEWLHEANLIIFE